MTAPLVGLEQDLVGQDVQLLLNLTLDVLRPKAAEDATQIALVDGVTDRLAGAGDHLDEETELGGQGIPFPLLLYQEPTQGDACHGLDLSFVYQRSRPSRLL